jgi:hypothetical protein
MNENAIKIGFLATCLAYTSGSFSKARMKTTMNKAKIAFLIASLASFSLFAAATDAEIAAAKAKGQVWCNSASGSKACHPVGDKYYGKTKAGMFVDATALPAGYHMAGTTAKKAVKKTTAPKM